jgi:uncharacterized protein (TIGR02145 family)
MKTYKLVLFFLLLSCMIISSCKKTERQMGVTTGTASNISVNSADVSGFISDVGIGAIQHGHCYAKTANPTVDNLKTELGTPLIGDFSSNLSDLEFNTKYYVKAYISNGNEIVYGNEINFTTAANITDVDGNIYNIVQIGTQIWTKENLKTTKYNDGTSVINITDSAAWYQLYSSTPGYCWYNNNEATYKPTHGALYNWYSVNTGKLCPVGWHVPTNAEWTILLDFLTNNGYGYQGSGDDIAKSLAATGGWSISPTPGTPGNDLTSNNSSGFTAYPSGARFIEFSSIDYGAHWWTSTSESVNNAYQWILYYSNPLLGSGFWTKYVGFSVRCLKDN